MPGEIRVTGNSQEIKSEADCPRAAGQQMQWPAAGASEKELRKGRDMGDHQKQRRAPVRGAVGAAPVEVWAGSAGNAEH